MNPCTLSLETDLQTPYSDFISQLLLPNFLFLHSCEIKAGLPRRSRLVLGIHVDPVNIKAGIGRPGHEAIYMHALHVNKVITIHLHYNYTTDGVTTVPLNYRAQQHCSYPQLCTQLCRSILAMQLHKQCSKKLTTTTLYCNTSTLLLYRSVIMLHHTTLSVTTSVITCMLHLF